MGKKAQVPVLRTEMDKDLEKRVRESKDIDALTGEVLISINETLEMLEDTRRKSNAGYFCESVLRWVIICESKSSLRNKLLVKVLVEAGFEIKSYSKHRPRVCW